LAVAVFRDTLKATLEKSVEIDYSCLMSEGIVAIFSLEAVQPVPPNCEAIHIFIYSASLGYPYLQQYHTRRSETML
jgi:hypothetical protein